MAETDDFSYGYGEEDEVVTRIPFHPLDAVGPAGSINASTNDMLKWVELHLGDGQFQGQHFVNQATLRSMHQSHMLMEQPIIANAAISYPSYGLGWFIYDYDGIRVVEHGGNIDGFSALVFMIPEESLGMVLLTNKNGTRLGYTLAYTISDILLDREREDWYGQAYGDNEEDEEEEEEPKEEESITTPAPHPIEDYVGTYTHPGYGDVIIEMDGDELRATYYSFSGTIEHQQFDFWKGETEDLLAIDTRFETDRNGQITALYTVLEISLPEMRFERQPDDRLSDPDFLSTLCGTYALDGGIELVITLEGTTLSTKATGQPRIDLKPTQGNFFTLVGYEIISIEFLFEEDEVVGLVSHQPNGDFRANKVD